MFIMTIIYIKFKKPHNLETWNGINVKLALNKREVKDYLKLGIPGIITMSEWWFWEVTCFLVGNLGTKPLAAYSIAYNIIPLLWMIP